MSCTLECRAAASSKTSEFKAFMHLATLFFMICRMKENWEKHFVVDVDILVTM